MSVRHSLLALLDRGPSYGQRLKDEFEAWTGEVWPLNVGQVYTTLQRLERDGLVVAEPGGSADTVGQRYYELAAAGREELRAWLTSPGDGSPPPRDELVIKVLMALAVDGIDVVEVVDAQRRTLMSELQGFTRAKAALADDDLAGALVLDAQLFRIESAVRWLDHAEARVGRSGRISPSAAPASTSAAVEGVTR